MRKTFILLTFLCVSVMGWADPTTNIAEGKTAVSGWTSAMGDTEKPNNAIDGNTNTQWVAWGANGNEYNNRAWFGVDLGGVYSLTEFATIWRIEGAGDIPSHYIIQIASTLGDEAPADFVDDAEYGNEG